MVGMWQEECCGVGRHFPINVGIRYLGRGDLGGHASFCVRSPLIFTPIRVWYKFFGGPPLFFFSSRKSDLVCFERCLLLPLYLTTQGELRVRVEHEFNPNPVSPLFTKQVKKPAIFVQFTCPNL